MMKNNNKMNTIKLKRMVKALNILPDEIKYRTNTDDCHTHLIYSICNSVPELKKIYMEKYDITFKYSPNLWAQTLAKFLGFESISHLEAWADNNPELWGNEYGFEMFTTGGAFGQKLQTFPQSLIIKHWTAVLLRIEELNDKGEIQNGHK